MVFVCSFIALDGYLKMNDLTKREKLKVDSIPEDLSFTSWLMVSKDLFMEIGLHITFRTSGVIIAISTLLFAVHFYYGML